MKYNFYPFNRKGKYQIALVKGNKAVVSMPAPYRAPYNGYVALHKRNVPKKWWGDCSADALQYLVVHGGFTYCEKEGNYIVFGFDCAHLGDDENKQLRSADYVMQLTEQMEEQLLAYKKVIKVWRNSGKRKRINMMQKIIDSAKIKERLGFRAMIDTLTGGICFKEVNENDI